MKKNLSLLVAVMLLGAWVFSANATSAEECFGGIGVVIHKQDQNLTITGVIKDGPAHGAGLHINDKITAIDEQPTQKMTIHEIVSALRGDVGTPVQLIVLRPSENHEFNVNITRDEVCYKPLN